MKYIELMLLLLVMSCSASDNNRSQNSRLSSSNSKNRTPISTETKEEVTDANKGNISSDQNNSSSMNKPSTTPVTPTPTTPPITPATSPTGSTTPTISLKDQQEKAFREFLTVFHKRKNRKVLVENDSRHELLHDLGGTAWIESNPTTSNSFLLFDEYSHRTRSIQMMSLTRPLARNTLPTDLSSRDDSLYIMTEDDLTLVSTEMTESIWHDTRTTSFWGIRLIKDNVLAQYTSFYNENPGDNALMTKSYARQDVEKTLQLAEKDFEKAKQEAGTSLVIYTNIYNYTHHK